MNKGKSIVVVILSSLPGLAKPEPTKRLLHSYDSVTAIATAVAMRSGVLPLAFRETKLSFSFRV
jgi:hypothetical protein